MFNLNKGAWVQRSIGAFCAPGDYTKRETFNTRQTLNDMLALEFMSEKSHWISENAFLWCFKLADETDRATEETGKAATTFVFISTDGAVFIPISTNAKTHTDLAAFTHTDLAAFTHGELMGFDAVSEISDGWYSIEVNESYFSSFSTFTMLALCTGCADCQDKFIKRI